MVNTNFNVRTGVVYSDSPNLDAFGRLRTSEVFTMFDAKQLYDDAPLFFDTETGGAGATAWEDSVTTLSVAGNGDYAVRQTFQRFDYQNGKSQLILMTGALGDSPAGVVSRIGYFNSDSVAPYNTGLD